jgi:regulator of sigma E protease
MRLRELDARLRRLREVPNGQIVYQSIEGIKGSPLSYRAQLIGQQAGIVALLLLMSFAFYNDIARILN